MRHAIESDATANDVWVTAHSFLPKIFRDQRHIGAFLFVRQKVAAKNRPHTQHIEIIRCHSAAEQLHSIAESRQRERRHVFSSEILAHFLTSAIMLKPR